MPTSTPQGDDQPLRKSSQAKGNTTPMLPLRSVGFPRSSLTKSRPRPATEPQVSREFSRVNGKATGRLPSAPLEKKPSPPFLHAPGEAPQRQRISFGVFGLLFLVRGQGKGVGAGGWLGDPACRHCREGIDWQAGTHQTKGEVKDGNRLATYRRTEATKTPLASAHPKPLSVRFAGGGRIPAAVGVLRLV